MEKPEPETWTVTPIGPVLGFSESDGILKVVVVLDVCVLTVLVRLVVVDVTVTVLVELERETC